MSQSQQGSAILTNGNLQTYVDMYLEDYDQLPQNLKVPIGEWDVSRVTDMSFLFSSTNSTFNESLNSWDVSNVVNMYGMFANCLFFNQPLNNWNVSNVTNMAYMFANCRRFNQPLNNWDVSNVTDMNSMFYDCTQFNQSLITWNIRETTIITDMFVHAENMENENKPPILLVQRVLPARQIVDSAEVHKAAAKVRWNALNSFLEEKNGKQRPQANTSSFGTYLKSTIMAMMNQNTQFTEEERRDLNTVFTSRLDNLDYSEKSPVLLNALFNVLEYVKRQPPEFQKEYLSKYIYDCTNAYNGNDAQDRMTCSMGALERIILALNDACAFALSSAPNPEYEKIMGFLNPPQIDEVAKEWYKLHKTGTATAFPEGTTVEEKRKSLRDYLLQYFDDAAVIDAKIEEFEAAIGFDPESFAYGGKKTRRRRRRKRRTTTCKKRRRRTRTKTKHCRQTRIKTKRC